MAKKNGGVSWPKAVLATVVLGSCGMGVLSGCGDTSAASKGALSDAQDGIRVARSAGDYRLKDGVLDEIKTKSDEELKTYTQAASSELRKDPKSADKYFEHKGRAEDLQTAITLVQKAADEELPAPLKAVVKGDLGAVSRQRASELLATQQDKLLELSRRASMLQDQASFVIELGLEAQAQEARSKAQATSMAEAQSAAEAAKGDVNKAKGAVDDLKKQIDDKTAQATQIYSQTEQAFQQAEQLKGQQAVSAGQKAMDDRKAGDQLTAEAAALQSSLSEAQATLEIATIKQKEADAKLAAVQAGIQAQQTRSQGAAELATSLRDKAKQFVEADKGLTQQYKEFTALAADIDKNVKSVASESTAADKAFGDAVSELNTAHANLLAIPDLDSSDALAKVGNDKDAVGLLVLQQAAARAQTGQAYLVGATAQRMLAGGQQVKDEADKAIGAGPSAVGATSGPSDAGAAYLAQATKEFSGADNLLKPLGNSAAMPMKWLVPALQGAVEYGQYQADGKAETLKMAQDKFAAALATNPNLRLPQLADNTAPGAMPAETPAPEPTAPKATTAPKPTTPAVPAE